MVRVALAGKEFTDVGLMMQLPAPNVLGQPRVTVPLKLSCDVIEIGPLTAMLPALSSGNGTGSVRMKSGFAVTFRVNDLVSVVGAPAVVA